MSWLRFITVQAVLFSAAACFAAEPNLQGEKEKTTVLRETAQNWIQVGIAQSKKGLYVQAEKSFLAAQEYQVYLTVEEQKQLEKNISEAHQGVVERQPALEHMTKARELLSQGQPVKARAHYEQVRTSPYLTEQERKQIDKEFKDVDSSLDKQRVEMTEIYYRSVQLYNADELEKARDGFVEVARYGMLVVPKGQTPEDYLIQIDSTLTGKFKHRPDMNAPPAKVEYAGQPAPSGTKAPFLKRFAYFIIGKKLVETPPPETRATPLKPGPAKPPVKKQAAEEPKVKQTQEKTAEVVAAAEPPSQKEMSSAAAQKVTPESKVENSPDKDARVKIAKTYTKALVDDTVKKVDYYIGTDEFDKAIAKVRTATDVVKENRLLIGDELFKQYSVRLKQLADKIAKVHKVP
jgi:tetratricopeptide (TPR) repeat protein